MNSATQYLAFKIGADKKKQSAAIYLNTEGLGFGIHATLPTESIGLWHGGKYNNWNDRKEKRTRQTGNVSVVLYYHLPKIIGKSCPKTKARCD